MCSIGVECNQDVVLVVHRIFLKDLLTRVDNTIFYFLDIINFSILRFVILSALRDFTRLDYTQHFETMY
jgi:hypothetical protein